LRAEDDRAMSIAIGHDPLAESDLKTFCRVIS